jgi:hypothetical protein
MLGFGLGICGPSFAAEPGKIERHVAVQGQGKIEAVPDQVRLWLEVSEQGSRVDQVTQEVRRKIDAVLKAVKAQGVAEKDLQTQAYQVSPQMEWKNGKSTRVGYSASNRVEVTIRDLKKTGATLSAALDAGANNVNGPQFSFENPQALERKALDLAMEDARAKAALLAQAAGASLGEVLTIDEGNLTPPVPRPFYARALMAGAAAQAAQPEPIEQGQETVQATVHVTFALK